MNKASKPLNPTSSKSHQLLTKDVVGLRVLIGSCYSTKERSAFQFQRDLDFADDDAAVFSCTYRLLAWTRRVGYGR